MLNKLADVYNRQDIVDGYMYGVFNYLEYFDLLSRFKIDEYKSYQLRIIKRRKYVVNCCVRIEYHIDNKRHRDDDQSAVEWSDGSKEWYQNDKIHRNNDRPAVENVSGSKLWYQNGKRHRDNDKPAIEWLDGSKWWQNDMFIRSSKN
jgi:hypothetical protein